MIIETPIGKNLTAIFLAANETIATHSMTRAWGLQPEEWTLLVHTGDNAVIECLQQAGDMHLTVTAAETTLSISNDIGHSLIVQTAGHGHFQFKLTESVFQDVAWLLRDFIAITPPGFLSAHYQEANNPEDILVDFFGQTAQVFLLR
jgi:hypothetical protein